MPAPWLTGRGVCLLQYTGAMWLPVFFQTIFNEFLCFDLYCDKASVEFLGVVLRHEGA